MRGARVGVALASYNRPEGLLAAVDSLCAQTHQDWCCVVADDASEDPAVGRILEDLGGDPRFSSIVGPRRTAREKKEVVCTFGALVNAAVDRLRRAGCELFCYLVDDVTYFPGRLAEHVSFLDANPGVFLVWGEQWLEEYDEEGRLRCARRQVPDSGAGSMKYIRTRLAANSFINHCSPTHRRTAARWSTKPRHWQTLDQAFWLECLRLDQSAVFHHIPFVGELMKSTPRDIGPVLHRGGDVAEVVRLRGGS